MLTHGCILAIYLATQKGLTWSCLGDDVKGTTPQNLPRGQISGEPRLGSRVTTHFVLGSSRKLHLRWPVRDITTDTTAPLQGKGSGNPTGWPDIHVSTHGCQELWRKWRTRFPWSEVRYRSTRSWIFSLVTLGLVMSRVAPWLRGVELIIVVRSYVGSGVNATSQQSLWWWSRWTTIYIHFIFIQHSASNFF